MQLISYKRKKGRLSRTSICFDGECRSAAEAMRCWLILAIAAMASVAVVAVVVTERFRRDAQSAKTTEQAEKLTDRIELAMYGELFLQANKAEQALGFSNPSQNFCYIQPSLWLADGALLWRGLLIVPDDVGNMVMLSQPLPEGTHTSARLRYDCFTIEKNGVQ